MSEIKVRLAKLEDYPFIFATWLKSYRTSNFAKSIPNKTYFSWHHKIIELLLKRSKVLIAYTENENQILGYLVSEPHLKTIHYVYTKGPFQKLGVGRTLLNASGLSQNDSIEFTHGSKEMSWIINKLPNLQYNPYAI